MVNGTVNPLQTVIKIAIMLPHPPGCSSPSVLQGSLTSALQGQQQGQGIFCVQEVVKIFKRLDVGHPLLVSVSQEHQTSHDLSVWAHPPKTNSLASSDRASFITTVTWSLLCQCIGQVDTGKGAIIWLWTVNWRSFVLCLFHCRDRRHSGMSRLIILQ